MDYIDEQRARYKTWLSNLILARAKWVQTPAANVTPGLAAWSQDTVQPSCGVIACFGGHLATWPEFQAMGVRVSTHGSPHIPPKDDPFSQGPEGCMVAGVLFGRPTLFKSRGCCGYDNDDVDHLSDHALVLHRLDSAIAAVKEQL